MKWKCFGKVLAVGMALGVFFCLGKGVGAAGSYDCTPQHECLGCLDYQEKRDCNALPKVETTFGCIPEHECRGCVADQERQDCNRAVACNANCAGYTDLQQKDKCLEDCPVGRPVISHDRTEGESYFDQLWLSAGNPGSAVSGRYFSVASIVNKAITFLLWGAGIVFFALVLFSGYKMIFMPDKERSWSSAKQNLTTGVIGMIVTFGAYWVVQIIFRLVGIGGWFGT